MFLAARLKNVMLPDDSILMKQPRGTTAHCISKVLDTDIVAVIWKDTKIVSLLSTFTAIDPVVKVSRFDRKQKKRIEVDYPNIIQVYNRHMGGVDLLDGLLGRHKIKMRSRKWYMRVFHHLLDVTVVNSWLLHKRIQKQKGNNSVLSLVKFREQLALSLCKIGTYTPKRGRPTNDVQEGIIKKGKMGTKIGQHAPPKEVRTDKLDHWPIESEKKTRCKNPGCKGFTFMMCGKCQISLCCGKGLTCFTKWHTT
ncbi:piggyBac transposable element-derived protein 3-like [Rhopalosiphum maidis]|uniref:piggyBac transposable element-derived protein 3-like n=1 Tax=Rhopalosiphum maidis TaxID=43146 RepID=UPI000EFEDC8F|nr:piggyBac transposable element-derived protein 3-like [Rhopalosiphum maidis]